MAAGAAIHLIPEKIGALAASVSAGGRAVTRAFVDLWSGPPEQAQTAYLRFAECKFYLLFAKSGSDTILFFLHKRPARAILDAMISFRIDPWPDHLPLRALGTSDIGMRFVLPSFLINRPSRQDLDRLGFGAASTSDNTALFALGRERKDILAIMNPEAGRQAQIRYSPGGVPGPVEPQRGRYSLSWILMFIRTLASWVESDLVTGERLPARVEADEQSVAGILFYLLSAYVKASSLVAQPAADVGQLPDIFQKAYVVNNYQTDLKLRLSANGTLSDAEDYQTSQLTLRLRIQNGDEHTAEITAIPNELAVSEPLLAAFSAALEFNVQRETWGHLLGVNPMFVPLFLQSARSSPIVFRIGRDRYADTDVVILSGMLEGQWLTVVLTARFTVDMRSDPPSVDISPDSIEILAKVAGDGSKASVDFDTAAFLLKYVTNSLTWMKALR